MRLGPSVGAWVSLLLVTQTSLADRVAVLPTLGDEAPAARGALTQHLEGALGALEHEVVDDATLADAMQGIDDGVADTTPEYVAVGRATQADWVVVGTTEVAVSTDRVEIYACLVSLGRVESVAREVDAAHAPEQIREMLEVLLRPEGIGEGALPWERTPPAPLPVAADAPPAEVAVAGPTAASTARVAPGPRKIHMDYMSSRVDVWPPYSAGRGVVLGASQGVSFAAVSPDGAQGGSGAIVGSVRGGYAPGDLGIELLVEVGGNLLGPRAMWVEGAARWMVTPSVAFDDDDYGGSFHAGPRVYAGAFVRFAGDDVTGPSGQTFSSETTGHPTLGGTFDMILSATPDIQAEASLGDVRWVPVDDGSILLVGATLGASVRF